MENNTELAEAEIRLEGSGEDEVFLNSAKTDSIDDIVLNPYSPSRIVAAQRMGLLYPYVGDVGVARAQKGGVYPGALMDVGIVLWLRSLPDKPTEEQEWTPKKALSMPDDATDQVLLFLDEHKITSMTGGAFVKAFAKFMETVQDAEQSDFEVASTEGGAGEETPKI